MHTICLHEVLDSQDDNFYVIKIFLIDIGIGGRINVCLWVQA